MDLGRVPEAAVSDDVAPPSYEAPAIETRTSSRDPLVWVQVASPVCL